MFFNIKDYLHKCFLYLDISIVKH